MFKQNHTFLILGPYLLDHRLKVLLIMFDSPEQKAEKAKVLKKLMSKWLSVQATEGKAHLLLSKNPHIRPVKRQRKNDPHQNSRS
jgi:hypothetical protein